tara:strand:+ start:486 stop:644 length:159 start_codon:yes stop_codon:yes gene_type:complete
MLKIIELILNFLNRLKIKSKCCECSSRAQPIEDASAETKERHKGIKGLDGDI